MFSLRLVVKDNLRWALTAARWASNVVHRDAAHNRNLWNNKLPTELAFWEKWVATRGLSWPEEFRKRTDQDAEIEPSIAQFIESETDKLLDVGAGPLTVIGTRWNGYKMD